MHRWTKIHWTHSTSLQFPTECPIISNHLWVSNHNRTIFQRGSTVPKDPTWHSERLCANTSFQYSWHIARARVHSPHTCNPTPPKHGPCHNTYSMVNHVNLNIAWLWHLVLHLWPSLTKLDSTLAAAVLKSSWHYVIFQLVCVWFEYPRNCPTTVPFDRAHANSSANILYGWHSLTFRIWEKSTQIQQTIWKHNKINQTSACTYSSDAGPQESAGQMDKPLYVLYSYHNK